MTNEEMAKAIEEIQGHHDRLFSEVSRFADLCERILRLREKDEERFTRLEDFMIRLVGLMEGLASTQKGVTETAEKITDVQISTSQKVFENDERLNALIDIVERFLSERREREGET